MSRYITIKYADRGLVVGGEVADLHDQLYLTAAVTLHTFFYGVISTRHFRPEEQEVIFMSVCLGHEIVPSNQPFKDVFVTFGVMLAAMTPSWILYIAAKRFVRVRSKGNLPPAILGRYRRNVVTYNETIVFNTITVFVELISVLIMMTLDSVVVVYLQVLMFFTITMIMTVRAFNDPFLFQPKSKVKVSPENEGPLFYVRTPEMVPRRDFILSPSPRPPVNALNRVIFVRPGLLNINMAESIF